MGNILVIEIGQQNLKIAASSSPQRGSLKNLYFSSKSIGSLDDQVISKLIVDVLGGWRIKPTRIILSLPRNLVAVRNLMLPSKDKNELSKMVALHVVKVLPYKKEEMVTAYSVLEQTETGYSQILLSAVHRNTLNRHLKIITDAGFLVDKVYLSSCGIRDYMLTVRKNVIKKGGIYITVDVDAEYSDFIVYSKDKLLFTRSIIIGAMQLDNEAERSRFIKEIKQTIIIFKSEMENKKLQKIFMSGATSHIKNYEENLAQQLELPLEIIPPDEEVVKSDKIETTRNISLTACHQLLSEAPERISFFVPELQVNRVFKEKIANLIVAGSLMVYILFIISCMFLANVYNKNVYLRDLKVRTQLLEQETYGLARELELVNVASRVVKKRQLPLVFLLELHKLVSKEIAIKSVEVDEKNKVFIRGESLSLSDVYAFSERLRNSKYFSNVNNRSARRTKARRGELTEFEITASFNY